MFGYKDCGPRTPRNHWKWPGFVDCPACLWESLKVGANEAVTNSFAVLSIRAVIDLMLGSLLGITLGLPAYYTAARKVTLEHSTQIVFTELPEDDNQVAAWFKAQPNVINATVSREHKTVIVRYMRNGIFSKHIHPPWQTFGYGQTVFARWDIRFLTREVFQMFLLVSSLCTPVGFLLIGIWRRRRIAHTEGVRPLFLPGVWRIAVLWGILAGIALFAIGLVHSCLLSAVFGEATAKAGPFVYVPQFGFSSKILILAAGVLVAPTCEELFFRGVIYGAFATRGRSKAGAAVSAALFAVAHMNPVDLAVYVAFGLILAWTYWKTQSLTAPIVAHALNNAIALSLVILT